jgi:hypothetical protein
VLEELKSRLRITWTDEDIHLNRIIELSKAYLEELAGAPLDFVNDLVINELVLERCRYVYNNAADEFQKNYADDLLRLRLKTAVRLRSEANATTNA